MAGGWHIYQSYNATPSIPKYLDIKKNKTHHFGDGYSSMSIEKSNQPIVFPETDGWIRFTDGINSG